MICVHEFIECQGRLHRDDHIHGKTLRSVREGAEGAFQKGRGIEEDYYETRYQEWVRPVPVRCFPFDFGRKWEAFGRT